MAARAFCIPGVVLLFCAFVLSLIVAISLPALPALDITRTHFSSGSLGTGSSSGEIGQLRVRIFPVYPLFVKSKADAICWVVSQFGVWYVVVYYIAWNNHEREELSGCFE